jgi:adenylate cyclase
MPFDQIQCADLSRWSGNLDAPGWRKVVESVAALTAGAAASASRAARTGRKLSVCVLPFANMSDDPAQEYFSDGITEDIITDLSKVSALSVISRNSAFMFKAKSIDVPKVARELNVSHVLEGSVRKAGGRVRITAQLIDGANNDHIWAERYDRDLTDIFALQDEISEAIVRALKLKLLPQEKQAIEQRGTNNPEAYNLYLMARQYMITGNRGDTRREDAILRLCRRATELDPNYARAWSLIAYAQSSLRFNRGKAGDDGLAAAERALSLDPTLAEPHAIKARNAFDHGRHDEAFGEIEVALRLDPESDVVNIAAADLNLRSNRLEDAIRYYEKASALTEADYGSPGMLVSCYTAIGDQEGMRRAARMSLERAERLVAQDRNNGNAMAFGAGALAALGERDRAMEWMDRALLIDPDNIQMRYNFACMLSRMGDNVDAALEMLVPIFEAISLGMLSNARTDPDLDPLRADPRFQEMLAAAEARVAVAEAPE